MSGAAALLSAAHAAPGVTPSLTAPVITSTPPPKPKTTQIRGFSMQLNSAQPEAINGYLKAIDELADMGCTWINFSLAARQDNVHSESLSIIWQNIPPQKDLERIFRKAKARGMGVMLMPIVLLNNSGPKDWRGVIQPPSWDNWFASYTMYITFMAKLARACDIDLFCVGSELLSTEPLRDKWIDTINEIKQEFPGKLTYSANWDHYDVGRGGPSFWDHLDYIGMNNYNELANREGVSVDDLVKAWGPIKKDILDFVAREKKPFLFTEVGWHNLQNTIKEPWNYVATGEIDLSEQKRAFESFVLTWEKTPTTQYMGAFVWEWRPGGKPNERGSYSLQETPALDIIKKWMSKKS